MGIFNTLHRQVKQKRAISKEDLPSILDYANNERIPKFAYVITGNDVASTSYTSGSSVCGFDDVDDLEPPFYTSLAEISQSDWSTTLERMICPSTDMTKLFENVNAAVRSCPFHCEVSVEIDGSVPKEIITDNSLLFPSILLILSHCLKQSRPDAAPECNKVGLRIGRMSRGEGNELLVRCLQAGPPTESDRAEELFGNKESILGQLSIMVQSLGGHCGMDHGKWEPRAPTQSVYWFRIPYEIVNFENPLLETGLLQIHHDTEKEMTSTAGVRALAYARELGEL
jgi:hypothetical protein